MDPYHRSDERGRLGLAASKSFAGVDGFYLIGQWTEPGGGLPSVARNGRDVIRTIMKAEGKKSPRARPNVRMYISFIQAGAVLPSGRERDSGRTGHGEGLFKRWRNG